MNKLLIICGFICLNIQTIAQENLISGTIYDSNERMPIPFASISIANTSQGTISNDSGQFELKILPGTTTLSIKRLGYKEKTYRIEGRYKEIEILLEPWTYDLSEVTVKPKSALEYIKEAKTNYKNNLASSPFLTQAYFSLSKIYEQNEKVRLIKDETVFYTYFPNYANTSEHNVSQLILYKFFDNEVKIDFAEVMNVKKVKKKTDKLAKQRKDEIEEENQNNSKISGNGPDYVLSTFQNLIGLPFFRDENFKTLEFTFGDPSYYDNNELIVINFKNKKPIDPFSIYNGKIYLDKNKLAIVSIVYDELVKIPVILRPIVKMALGVNIQSMENTIQIHNQQHGQFWYPKMVIRHTKVNLKKSKMFAEDERLGMSMKHVFNIEEIHFNDIHPIPPSKVFDPKKDFEEQVFPVEGVIWDNINIIKG